MSTPIPRLEDVLDTIGNAVKSAISGATSSRFIVAKGSPVATELVKIMGAQQVFVGIIPMGTSKNLTRYDPWDLAIQVTPTIALTGNINGQVLTFGGTSSSGLNVHVFAGNPIRDVLIQTISTDTPSTIAAKVAAAVVALGLSGVSASAVGPVVTFTGSPKLACTIGGAGSYLQEIAREAMLLQVSVYAPTSVLRFAVGQAIKTQVGTVRTRHYALSDNMDMYLRYQGQRFIDKAQSSYGCLEWHLTYDAEYPDTINIPAMQIGAGEEIRVMNALAPVTMYSS